VPALRVQGHTFSWVTMFVFGSRFWQGRNPQGLERMQKLAHVVKLRESLPQPPPTQESAPAAALQWEPNSGEAAGASFMSRASRPLTMNSQYSDMTAMSGSTVYMHDDKLVKKLPFDVRRQLIRSMKRKWDEVNKEYQLLTLSLFNLDTVNKVTKKEACEETMVCVCSSVCAVLIHIPSRVTIYYAYFVFRVCFFACLNPCLSTLTYLSLSLCTRDRFY